MPNQRDQLIDAIRLPRNWIRFRDTTDLRTWLEGHDGVAWRVIGQSRQGQELFGVTLGQGDRHVSVIAGSHADEPVGPLTAQLLPRVLSEHARELLDRFTFHIVPQMNPDGADRNRTWFADPPDMAQYVTHAVRELPGDDIEFGFGTDDRTRPENQAARAFLADHAPYFAHFSLHGMAFAEGAWFLLCKEWAGRAAPLMDALTAFCDRMQFPLHDVDRHGEKGFTRIRKGFCTTPTSDAMKEFFMQREDPETAALFRPSSMEMVREWGGDPLCMVSELPLFGIGVKSASLEESVSARFKEDLDLLRARSDTNWDAAVSNLAFKYEVGPVSVQFQVRAQLAMMFYALDMLDQE